MADTTTMPRRYMLPSEAPDGDSTRIERPEYVRWRKSMLETERDDLALRERLLNEQADALMEQAAAAARDGGDKISAADWDARIQAEAGGEELPDLPGQAERKRLEAEAKQLRQQAAECRTYIASTGVESDVDAHLKAVQER